MSTNARRSSVLRVDQHCCRRNENSSPAGQEASSLGVLVVVFVADQLDWFEASKTKPMPGAPIAMAAMAADDSKTSQQPAPQVAGRAAGVSKAGGRGAVGEGW